MRWLRRAALALFAMFAAAGVALWLYAQQALAHTEGVVRLAGPHAEIHIDRDDEGIPTIKAASVDDALFGLGFVHAQDRLWQLELNRRIGSGRLAEIFGAAALETDTFLRALGVRRSAAVQWSRTTGEARAAVLAYTAGINAWLDAAMKARPPEFLLLGVQPERWAPEDTLAWAVMMAWDLGGNWSTELLRMRLALKMPVGRINELLPPYPGEKPLVEADYAAVFRELKVDGRLGRQALSSAPESGAEGLGSNNWVVHGSRTETGKPLLANDPHLRLAAPSMWYLARIEAPGLRAAGATMPALPLVVLGQNEHLAWGFTNTAPDVQDLYLERIKPHDASQYQTPEGWAKFETFDEIIKVKGQADVRFVARATRHGPVISGASNAAEGLTGAGANPSFALAMRWTALDPDPGTLVAGLGFNRARSVAEFIAASSAYVAPMQNIVLADDAGQIAFLAAGRVPLRKAENELKGQVPSPGWDARYDWAGFLEPMQTPHELNPARGWSASANQRIHEAEYPHYITNEWTPPYRMQRIVQMLEARPRHSLDSFQAMQADELSLAARVLIPHLQQAQSGHPLAVRAQALLTGFDGTMAADKAAPLIFWAWVRQLTQAVFADDLGDAAWRGTLGSRSFRDALEGVLERQDAWWCDDKATLALETCGQQINVALTHALDELQATHGSDPEKWQWGQAHIARSEHRPFSSVKLLAKAFEPRVPVGGDTHSLNASRVSLKPDAESGALYFNDNGPGFRALYDLADRRQSRVIQSTGQSGIVFSPLYRGFVERWARVEYVPLWESTPRHSLVLQPSR